MPVTNCTQESFHFPPSRRRRVEANFNGGEISSDDGALLLPAPVWPALRRSRYLKVLSRTFALAAKALVFIGRIDEIPV